MCYSDKIALTNTISFSERSLYYRILGLKFFYAKKHLFILGFKFLNAIVANKILTICL